jgi:hypothetical protein
LLWLAEKLHRSLQMSSFHTPQRVEWHPSSSAVFVKLAPTPELAHQPGQYFFVNIPSLSLTEWHPFTASAAPDGGVALYIKQSSAHGAHTQPHPIASPPQRSFFAKVMSLIMLAPVRVHRPWTQRLARLAQYVEATPRSSYNSATNQSKSAHKAGIQSAGQQGDVSAHLSVSASVPAYARQSAAGSTPSHASVASQNSSDYASQRLLAPNHTSGIPGGGHHSSASRATSDASRSDQTSRTDVDVEQGSQTGMLHTAESSLSVSLLHHPSVRVYGPFGHFDASHHEQLLLFAGGIGITPMIAVFANLQRQVRTGLPIGALKRVVLVWMSRHVSEFRMFEDIFEAMVSTARDPGSDAADSDESYVTGPDSTMGAGASSLVHKSLAAVQEETEDGTIMILPPHAGIHMHKQRPVTSHSGLASFSTTDPVPTTAAATTTAATAATAAATTAATTVTPTISELTAAPSAAGKALHQAEEGAHIQLPGQVQASATTTTTTTRPPAPTTTRPPAPTTKASRRRSSLRSLRKDSSFSLSPTTPAGAVPCRFELRLHCTRRESHAAVTDPASKDFVSPYIIYGRVNMDALFDEFRNQRDKAFLQAHHGNETCPSTTPTPACSSSLFSPERSQHRVLTAVCGPQALAADVSARSWTHDFDFHAERFEF